MFVAACDVPNNIPNTPNARTPKINRQIHREIQWSLLDQGENVPGTFHLKHSGITIVAQSVRKSGENYIIDFGSSHGILDGGHSYEIIKDCQIIDIDLSNQFIKFEILTKVPDEWIAAISGGLNSSVQVQPMSLANLAGKFDWLKDELAIPKFTKNIAWKEGDAGEYTARDIVALLACMNIELYPNEVTM